MHGSFMSKGRQKRRRRVVEDKIESTEQTRRKLEPDPLALILMGQDVSLEHAADEIKAVYNAVCAGLFTARQRLGSPNGKPDIPDEIAWAHAQTYIPWFNNTERQVASATIELVSYRTPWPRPTLAIKIRQALWNYAGMMRMRGQMP